MTGRRWRLSVFLFIALLSLSLIMQSRTVPTRKSAAFLRYTSGAVILKVTGTDSQDGIYRIIDGLDNEYVKNMTQKKLSSLSMYFPAYHDENTIEPLTRAGVAIARQLSDDIEIIIVHDQSPDRTGEVADRMAKEFKEVRVIHHPENRGVGNAMISGYNKQDVT